MYIEKSFCRQSFKSPTLVEKTCWLRQGKQFRPALDVISLYIVSTYSLAKSNSLAQLSLAEVPIRKTFQVAEVLFRKVHMIKLHSGLQVTFVALHQTLGNPGGITRAPNFIDNCMPCIQHDLLLWTILQRRFVTETKKIERCYFQFFHHKSNIFRTASISSRKSESDAVLLNQFTETIRHVSWERDENSNLEDFFYMNFLRIL